MQTRHLSLLRLFLLLICSLIPVLTWSQGTSPQSRITERVSETTLTTLRGNTHPLAQLQFDRGAAPPDLPMARMLLVLKRSAEQEAALQKLLDEQQDRNSPNYHQWLTPDAFGQQFGPSDQDIQTVSTWLQSHGFQTSQVARGRTVIEFSGTAAQVQQAFHTEIHKYVVNGEEHWANASDPQIPSALSPVLDGVNSLHNFVAKPMHHVAGVFSRSTTTGQVRPVNPQFTYPDAQHCVPECFAVGPYDFAMIYNVLPLWKAQPPIDGTGQSIAIVGRSNINIQDVRDFRTLFGLPLNDPQIILDGPDPGLVPGDETESDLDLEWAGAVAKGATIKLVTSQSTETQDGVDLSALYVVDHNLSPIMSVGYGLCEMFLGTAGNQFNSDLMEQAAAQGMTVMVATGDSGSTSCDVGKFWSDYGAAVDGFASTPFNVAVGGTDFLNFGTNFASTAPSPYWNTTNDLHDDSAKGYIPEMPWNESCSSPAYLSLQPTGTTAEANCNQAFVYSIIGGGGGASNCIKSDGQDVTSCSGGYAKPPWQTGAGVPNDNARDLPDVSLFSSGGFIDSFYIVCEADAEPKAPTCNLTSPYTNFIGVGGTSAAAPAFAGIMALVDQFNNPSGSNGLGNANYVLYKLPALASQTGLNCNSSTGPDSRCVFNDVTLGTIAMPCRAGTPDCVQNTPSVDRNQVGLVSGVDATPGYDKATGLGTVNVYNLVHDWNLVTFSRSSTSLSLNNGNTVSITHGQSVPVSVTVTGSGGTPTGDVSLVATPATGNSAGVDRYTLNNGTASGNTSLLPGGTYTVKAHYEGDSTYGGSDSSAVSVNVGKEGSAAQLSIVTFDASGRGTNTNATTMPYGTPYILRAQVTSAAGTSCAPNPTGESACPTGNLALTDNGSPLDAGTYVLNSKGYLEDQPIQLGGGSHTLGAQYEGDNSFASSSATPLNIAVTPGQTILTTGASTFQPSIGSNVTITARIDTFSNGVPPNGTVSFFAGKMPLGNPVPVTGVPANISLGAPYPEGTAAFTTSQLPVGENEITAQYSGDANYAASTTGQFLIDVLIPTTIQVTTSNPTVSQGAPVTFTVRIIPSQQNGPTMRGFVLLTASNYMSGQISPSTNDQVQIVVNSSPPFLATGSYPITAQYYSDGNYAASTGSTMETVTPQPGTDFAFGSVSPPLLTIPAPGAFANTVTVPIAAINGFSGTINFPSPASCSISPAGSQATCQVNPAFVIGSGNLTISIFTTAPSRVVPLPRALPGTPVWWAALGGLASLVLVVALACSKRQPRWSRAFGLLSFALLATALLGCGGGSTGGSIETVGGGNAGTPTGVVYTATVTGTCGPLTHSTSFTFTVQ